MTVSMTFGTSGCSKSVCFNSSCLARIPAGLPRLTGVLLMMYHVLEFKKNVIRSSPYEVLVYPMRIVFSIDVYRGFERGANTYPM